MGIELWANEVPRDGSSYSMTGEPDADGCLRAFSFFLACVFFILRRFKGNNNKFQYKVVDIVQYVAVGHAFLVIIRQIVVLSMTEYISSPAGNLFFIFTELNSTELQAFEIAWLFGVIAAWVRAICVAFNWKRPWIGIGAFGIWFVLANLPLKVFNAMPPSEVRISEGQKYSGVLASFQLVVFFVIALAFGLIIQQKLRRFKGNKQERIGGKIAQISIRSFLLILFLFPFHLIGTRVWPNIEKDGTGLCSTSDYLTYLTIMMCFYTIIWAHLLWELESMSRKKTARSKPGSQTAVSEATGGSESASVSASGAMPPNTDASVAV